jgi:hypothetical protein
MFTFTVRDCIGLQDRRSANFIKLNLGKIRVISFTRKTNMLNYRHNLGNCLILQNDLIQNMSVQIDYKLYFHHVDFFSHEINFLRLTTASVV